MRVRGPVRGSGVAVAVTGGAVLASLVAAWFLVSPQRDAAGDLPPSEEPLSSAPAAEVRVVHEALHTLGERCAVEDGEPPDVAAEVVAILRFADLYPEGRFAIDDEDGTPLSLLLVTRAALDTCAPEAAVRVNEVLPPEFRSPS